MSLRVVDPLEGVEVGEGDDQRLGRRQGCELRREPGVDDAAGRAPGERVGVGLCARSSDRSIAVDLGGDQPCEESHRREVGLDVIDCAGVSRAEGAPELAVGRLDRDGDVDLEAERAGGVVVAPHCRDAPGGQRGLEPDRTGVPSAVADVRTVGLPAPSSWLTKATSMASCSQTRVSSRTGTACGSPVTEQASSWSTGTALTRVSSRA